MIRCRIWDFIWEIGIIEDVPSEYQDTMIPIVCHAIRIMDWDHEGIGAMVGGSKKFFRSIF